MARFPVAPTANAQLTDLDLQCAERPRTPEIQGQTVAVGNATALSCAGIADAACQRGLSREKKTAMKAIRLAAVSGFLAVALGAFGAHGLKSVLEQHGTTAIWHTAVLYQLAHAVVLLVLATRPGGRCSRAFWCFVAGIVVFSGSLYLLAATNLHWLGAVTPFGGICLLAGWLLLALKGFEKE